MNLKRNLGRLLADHHLSAAKLARLSGVPQTTLADWLSGGNPRDMRKVKKVANFFKLTLDELCFGDPANTVAPIENYLEEIRAGVFEVILKRTKGE